MSWSFAIILYGEFCIVILYVSNRGMSVSLHP